jgi:hypothetical protein
LSPAASPVPESGSRLRRAGIWGAPLAVLFAVWLWLVYSSGGFIAHQWLPPSLALGVFGLIVSLLVAYPRRPGQLSLGALFLFGGYSIWVAVSALWADSPTRVWLESGRTFTYLLVFALAVVYLSDRGARRVFRYLVMAAGCVLLAVCAWKLGTTDNIAGLFYSGNRLGYPVSAPNHAAALLLVAFWPLMWLAAGPEERAPVRGVALGLATGLLGLSFMTQSRGALWTLAITLLFTFIISPARLRTLFYLVVPALLMVYVFPRLNRYWLEGPESVGGALAVRTVLAAAVTAAFIGMILALLEKWVRVSRRMKVIFGAFVLIAAIGGLVYGSITMTRDAGGPMQWASQTWRQFTGQTAPDPVSESHSRFTLLTSSGRVGIWKVAVQEIEQAPVLGVGADNFVFQYQRLRTTETYKPQQAHSFELQVLGETGVVGGVFAFGGILLILWGLLWPRCAAGWRGARESWLCRRGPTSDAQAARAAPVCNLRWGKDSITYGWEMALLAGAAYWLIHASIDWLWQMAGVSIPAVLLAAAGVAGIDGRAGVLWPRLGRRLRLRVPSTPSDPQTEEIVAPHESAVLADSIEVEGLMMIAPRAAQYEGRVRRRSRREQRKSRARDLFHPPGPLSQVFRLLLVALSLVVIISTGLPYMSLLYQDSALALADTDPARAIRRAGSALSLMPTDPAPYSTQASIYSRAAAEAVASEAPDREGAVLDDLALAIESHRQAITLEPANWTLHFHAGVAVVDLLLATGYVEGWGFGFEYADLSANLTGLGDWSSLAGGGAIPGPGQAAASLAQDEVTLDYAEYYRGMSREELAGLAQNFLQAAKERNPLAGQIDATLAVLANIDATD